MKTYDLTGYQFDGWTVLGPHPDLVTPRGFVCVAWMCRCKCGVEKPVREGDLLNHKSRSCRSCSATKHGQSRTKTYQAAKTARYRERKRLERLRLVDDANSSSTTATALAGQTPPQSS